MPITINNCKKCGKEPQVRINDDDKLVVSCCTETSLSHGNLMPFDYWNFRNSTRQTTGANSLDHVIYFRDDNDGWDGRMERLCGAIIREFRDEPDMLRGLQKLKDHKGVLTIVQSQMNCDALKRIADLWELIGSEPADNVFVCCGCGRC